MVIKVNSQAETDFLGNLVRFYQVALGRQPDNAGLEYWYNQGKANGLDLVKTTAGFIPPEQLLHTPERFVSDLYHSVLGRDPDDSGWSYWLNQIENGMSYQKVALSFALSSEFKTATSAGVASVVAKAIAGQAIDTHQVLGGVQAYDYGPKPPVTVEVPVEVIKEVKVYVDNPYPVPTPTAEAHVLTFNPDKTVSVQAQKANGDLLVGTSIPATDFAVLHDNTANVEIAARIAHRQSGEDVAPIASGISGNRAFVEYNIDAGTQNGLHNNPVNINRSEAQFNFAITGGSGFMADGDTQYVMKFFKEGALVNTITLSADANGNQQWKMPDGVTVAIGDDPVSTVVANNSVNMAFPFAFADADLDVGTYKISIEQVGLVGLQAGQVTAALDVIFHAV